MSKLRSALLSGAAYGVGALGVAMLVNASVSDLNPACVVGTLKGCVDGSDLIKAIPPAGLASGSTGGVSLGGNFVPDTMADAEREVLTWPLYSIALTRLS